MKIQSMKNTSPTYFKAYGGKTENIKSSNKMNDCIHESHFMRDLESLCFITDYVKNNFPNGTHIADFGCSNGEETYSLATLLSASNKDKKYKITGYDIAPNVIEDAKTGVFNIGSIFDDYEKFLVGLYSPSNLLKQKVKDAFLECFEKIPGKWKNFNMCGPRWKHKAEKRFCQPNQNSELIIKRIEYVQSSQNRKCTDGTDFIPRNGIFNDIINFKVADISNINNELEPEKTGVVVFKNSLYHVLNSQTLDYSQTDASIATKLFKKINSILSDKGLFVLGCLKHDHFYSKKQVPQSKLSQLYQNGKQITVFNSSPIHKALRKAGFEPIFYDSSNSNKGIFTSFREIEPYFPAIWKKIKHI